jgi:hypothetical protein
MKTNLLLLFITLSYINFSCYDNKQKRLNIDNSKSEMLCDTILFKGKIYAILEYTSDSTYILNWGNSKVKNTSDTLFIFPIGKPVVEFYNEDAIIMRQGCGTSCFFAYIFPLENNMKEKIYMYPMAFDSINNLIAYCNDTNDFFLTIENYTSGKKKIIHEDFLYGPFSGIGIDSIFFDIKGLFVKWRNNEEKLVEKVFKLNEIISF